MRSGQTFGWNGALITIAVGQSSTAADFVRDWMMTHEMLHLAFPSVAERHHWIEEGLSTYVESVARARAGDLTAEKAWGDLVDGLPQGLPQSGDRVWISRPPGDGHIGAAPCFVCAPTSKSESGQEIEKVSSMPCEQF